MYCAPGSPLAEVSHSQSRVQSRLLNSDLIMHIPPLCSSFSTPSVVARFGAVQVPMLLGGRRRALPLYASICDVRCTTELVNKNLDQMKYLEWSQLLHKVFSSDDGYNHNHSKVVLHLGAFYHPCIFRTKSAISSNSVTRPWARYFRLLNYPYMSEIQLGMVKPAIAKHYRYNCCNSTTR